MNQKKGGRICRPVQYSKKHTGKPTIPYDDAVEEGCVWVDRQPCQTDR